jgi:hypothetical protein
VFDEKWLPGFGLIPILAALRAEIETRKLGQQERADLRRWYWCNVFLERYSSGVESKSRKDYQEMLGYWLAGKDEPEVFHEARSRIGAPGFRIRTSASYASSVYSGVFCLLALHNARDWHYGEAITLQELNDHHIFPQAYLLRYNITSRIPRQPRNLLLPELRISHPLMRHRRLPGRFTPAVGLQADSRLLAVGVGEE